MDLGNFSISLSVKDLAKTRAFYEAFGFEQIAGDASQNWLILRNGEAKIGLFQGMFEGNMITFNPSDARGVQASLKRAGYTPETEAADGEGPAHFAIKDPDGNLILVDQH